MTEIIDCPYCGELFETAVDSSAGNQNYIEDCPVCCRPHVLRVRVEADGRYSITATAE